MYLVDTNVISAGAPAKRVASPALVAWMGLRSSSLFVSVITIAEIEAGIAKLRRQGATRRASDIDSWLATVLHLYASRVLLFDTAIAHVAGVLIDRARALGRSTGLADIVIAATAVHHGLTVLTQNTADFQGLGVALDPFRALPT